MIKKFSVLFLASWYPTPFNSTHGIFIRNHAKALSQYCNVVVIYVTTSDETSEIVLEHTQTENLNEYILVFPKSKLSFIRSFIHFIKYCYYYFKLSLLVKKHFNKIEFAQINVVYPVSLFFPIVKYILSIKNYTVFEQWTGYLKEDNLYKGLLRKWTTQRVIANARKIWCLCEYQKHSMVNHHHLYGNYDLLGNVVNTEIFVPIKKKDIKKKKRFLHVSTLDNRQKNITGILNVFKEIENEGYDFELIIIGGKDDYLKNAIHTAQTIGLKNVVFKGTVPQEELPHYYQSANALVMFSNYETFCVVIYEALSCGTYVITTNVADLDKIITEKFGTIVSIGNEKQLKTAILKVLNNPIADHQEEAHQLIVQHFSEKQIGKKLFDYYYTLITTSI
ncbi:MAG: glycosyltransferase [Bacteroidia bacterium]|nr:glycosyltransferase [Bacteroidia bacterium]